MHASRVLKAIKILLFALVIATALGFIVKGLWNALMPQIFGWHAICFWQALGLLILCKILFGGFHHRPRGNSRWKDRMKARLEQMTPEQRERFREGMRCGRRPFSSAAEPEARQ